ncbi:MAG: hypothetical protein JW850_00480 [Thermoflexales bacterium]|nr:hypothetical protein [Thermoflexales bacterium]
MSQIRYAAWLALALLLAVSAWGGLYYLVTQVHTPVPPPWPRAAAFLALWGTALLGSSWPILLAVNQRLDPQTPPARVWRQSAWIGLLGVFVAWLQINRALGAVLVITLAGGLGLIEALLILRANLSKTGKK